MLLFVLLLVGDWFVWGGVSSFEILGRVQSLGCLSLLARFPYQQSKLEKADILEMTVKHLQNIQSSKLMGECPVPSLRARAALGQEGTSRFNPLAA